jgi:hypothetical protein
MNNNKYTDEGYNYKYNSVTVWLWALTSYSYLVSGNRCDLQTELSTLVRLVIHNRHCNATRHLRTVHVAVFDMFKLEVAHHLEDKHLQLKHPKDLLSVLDIKSYFSTNAKRQPMQALVPAAKVSLISLSQSTKRMSMKKAQDEQVGIYTHGDRSLVVRSVEPTFRVEDISIFSEHSWIPYVCQYFQWLISLSSPLICSNRRKNLHSFRDR